MRCALACLVLLVAAWAAEPVELNVLLSLLAGPGAPDEQMAAEVDEWLKQRSPLLFWTVAEASDHVRLAALNTSSERVVARFTWVHTSDIPIAVPIDPGMLVNVRLDRAAPSPRVLPGQPALDLSAPHVLLVEIGSRRYRLDFRPPTSEVLISVVTRRPAHRSGGRSIGC